MHIRSAQLSELEAMFWESQAASFAARLRAEYANELSGMPDQQLLDDVQTSLSNARSYGLSTERDLEAFLAIDILLQPTIDDLDLLCALNDPEMPEDRWNDAPAGMEPSGDAHEEVAL
jgi:hypothetical protein